MIHFKKIFALALENYGLRNTVLNATIYPLYVQTGCIHNTLL